MYHESYEPLQTINFGQLWSFECILFEKTQNLVVSMVIIYLSKHRNMAVSMNKNEKRYSVKIFLMLVGVNLAKFKRYVSI